MGNLHWRDAVSLSELPTAVDLIRVRPDLEGGVLCRRGTDLVVFLLDLAVRGHLWLGAVRNFFHFHQLLLQQPFLRSDAPCDGSDHPPAASEANGFAVRSGQEAWHGRFAHELSMV